MAIAAVVAPAARLDAADRERLQALGMSLTPSDHGSGTAIADAVVLAAGADVLVAVAERSGDPREWRRLGAPLLGAATDACAAVTSPAVVVVLPATSTPRPGPVAVLSPPGSASTYELYVGAALAAATGRRVEHVNGRGSAGSAVRSALPARLAVRAAVPDWRERTEPRPERSLHALVSRPAAVVVPVAPGSADAALVIADHPDADVVLVFDVAHARYGAAVAQQVASMVELALGVGTSIADDAGATAPPPAGTPPETAVEERSDALPPIRASDVIHVRLTDTDLEIANRTRQRVRLRVALGSPSTPDRVRAVFEALLEPGESRSEAVGAVAAVAALAPPRAVLRHWSHSSAEVYEGGDRRILDVTVTVLDATGEPRATRTFGGHDRLDLAVTARDLSTVVGRVATRPVLPEPAPTRPRVRPPRDLWAALERALAAGSSVLAGRGA